MYWQCSASCLAYPYPTAKYTVITFNYDMKLDTVRGVLDLVDLAG